jgi:hypothetical protein
LELVIFKKFQSALLISKCLIKVHFDAIGLPIFVVARGSASLMLSTDGRAQFQTHEEPLNDVEALSILKVHFEI